MRHLTLKHPVQPDAGLFATRRGLMVRGWRPGEDRRHRPASARNQRLPLKKGELCQPDLLSPRTRHRKISQAWTVVFSAARVLEPGAARSTPSPGARDRATGHLGQSMAARRIVPDARSCRPSARPQTRLAALTAHVGHGLAGFPHQEELASIRLRSGRALHGEDAHESMWPMEVWDD
jgi:hypothetical protein